MADRRGALVPLIILAWIFLSPAPIQRTSSDPRLLEAPPVDQVIAAELGQLDVVAKSSWDAERGRAGHALNVTGWEPERGYAWDSLTSIKARAEELLEYALGEGGRAVLDGVPDAPDQTNSIPLYRNVTGHVRGRWKRSSLQDSVPTPQLNLTDYTPPSLFGRPISLERFERNVTGKSGEISIRFHEKEVDRSMTGSASDSAGTVEIKVEVQIKDSETHDEWESLLHGVYFLDLGQAVLTTTSSKFGGIFMLPHLALSPRTFESARSVLNDSISQTIQRQMDGETESRNPWTIKSEETSDDDFARPSCELVVYLQQLPPATEPQYSQAWLAFLERELRFPSGAILPNAPDLQFSLLVFSPDCGFVLESTGPPDDFAADDHHLTGPKLEVQQKLSRHHLLIFCAILALQLFLLARQMREASTPSTRSRISLYTIVILAFGDGFVTMTFVFMSYFIPSLWVNLMGIGFLGFLNVCLVGMRFLMDIWAVQAPERERRIRAEVEEDLQREQRFQNALQRIRAERQARLNHTTAAVNDAAPASNITIETSTTPAMTNQQLSSATGTAQTPPTEAQPISEDRQPPGTVLRPVDTGAAAVFMPSDQEGLLPITTPAPVDQNGLVAARMPSFGSLYMKFYLLLLAILFLTINASTWPAPARRIFFDLEALCSLSFWVPQIVRNIQRNCRHALNWEFVVGNSFLRLLPYFYLWGYKQNAIFADQDYYGLTILVVWVWVQLVILGSQELIGPRWFVRSGWAPPAYDYHPILREDEEGATMPIGLSRAEASPVHDRKDPLPQIRRASIPKESKEKGKRIFDCAICMQDLEVPVVEAGAPRDTTSLGANLLARRAYMVTPCRHIFHSTCLEGWMKYRLQCPICRETVPPL